MHSLDISLGIVIVLVALALAFDFMNGFHDAANAIASVVSTGVLKPLQAVALSATFNVIAVFVFQLKVATTVGRGIIDPGIVDHHIIFAALVGAIVWNFITWYFGIPSSSSHALIGGLVGSGLAKAGMQPMIWSGIGKTVAFIVISPMIGFFLGAFFRILVAWLFRRVMPSRADRWFRRAQIVSCSLYSLGHGGNDAQKTIGIIWMMLVAAGYVAQTSTAPPPWTIVACYMAMGMGTLFGGWRIVRTMGQRLTKLRPVAGVCADVSGSIALFTATSLGIPVSTTHTITGSIVGVGAARGMNKVRWGTTTGIVWAWVLTIPATALVAMLGWHISNLLF